MSRLSSASSDKKDSCTSTQEGLKLIKLLQNFLVQQNEQIEILKNSVKSLEEERDALLSKIRVNDTYSLRDIATQTDENKDLFQCQRSIAEERPE